MRAQQQHYSVARIIYTPGVVHRINSLKVIALVQRMPERVTADKRRGSATAVLFMVR